jgi:hemerythrin superfamily protein
MQNASRRSTSRSQSTSRARARTDAIALLKADHRQVEEWFEQFEKSRSDSKKADLATRICQALRIHTTIEEEIFYPAFLEATGEDDIHHEAEIEHASAKDLIAQIEQSGPDDDYFDAKVSVLSEMIKHHVKEEEKRDGMFAKAKAAGMDLQVLGEQLMARKSEMQGSSRPRAH